MRVIAKAYLNCHAENYPDAAQALFTWHSLITACDAKHFSELKSTFSSADAIRDGRVVFNIKGNQFRLVADIDYTRKAVFLKWFGPHKDYDKIDPAEVSYAPCKNRG